MMTEPSEFPRAPTLPWVGCLPYYLRDPLRFLVQSRDLGDLVHLRFPGVESYMVNAPALVDQVLVREASHLTKDRFLRDMRSLLGDGLLTSEGDFWRRQRKLSQPAFHRERIAGYADAMVDATRTELSGWRAGETRDVHEDLMRLTLDIVARTLFSADLDAQAARTVGPALHAIMERYGNALLMGFSTLAALPLRVNTRAREAIAQLDKIIYDIVTRRRRGAAPTTPRSDLLAMLLEARDDDGSAMTDKQVRDEVMTVFLAGHETTALALSWTFFELSRNPDVRAKLLHEVREVLGDRTATVADVASLKYTEAVVYESLRLHPPAWSIGRESTRDFELGGRTIPAGSNLWISPYALHRDPRHFSDPLRFRPERWLDGLARRLPRGTYLPFGGGPRVCIGNVFAQMEATLLLATISQRYSLTLSRDARIEAFPSVTLRPRYGVRVVLDSVASA